MARIIYGVAGEGFGHSSRAHLIGQHLIDSGNELILVASQKAYAYLAQYFGQSVREIFGLRLVYNNRNLSCTRTIATNLINFSRCYCETASLLSESFSSFRPELVISDFEPFSAWWAWHNDVPFVSIDHEHMLTMCKLRHSIRHWHPRLTSGLVARCHYFGASAYIVLNFFRASLKTESAILAPPVVRPVAYSCKPTAGEHIVLYTSDRSDRERLLETLGSAGKQRFHIYGYNESSERGNCVFKKTSTEGFLADLASCRGVIATAGFSLISECIHFNKKMLLLPIAGQYEQMINARYAEELGLGLSRNAFDSDALKEFLSSIDEPAADDERIIRPDNAAFFEILHEVLSNIDSGIEVTRSREPALV
jgi:uncharacterized protein (TIGR00661 family)